MKAAVSPLQGSAARLLLGLLLAALLAGCAASIRADRGRSGVVAATCADKTQCELYWHRTQEWVAQHSKQPVNNATDWMVITAPPSELDSSLSYVIKRWAGEKESGEIRFEAFCSPFLPCTPPAAAAFEDYQRFLTAP